MAISTTVFPRGDAPERNYPYLGVSGYGQNQLVVFFIKPKTGMCVSSGSSCGWFPGAYHELWAEAQFEIFHGKIEIEQE